MPEKETIEAAKRDLREGKSPLTAAGEFVPRGSNKCARGNTTYGRRSRPSPSD